MTASRSTLVLGATGLVGRDLVSFLLRETSVSSVVILVRRESRFVPHAKLHEFTVDFEHLDLHAAHFRVDQIFCALGTTMRRAETRARFARVDHDYPLIAAQLGRAQGAAHYLIVSALGANAHSRVFYNRVKGETERDVLSLGFPCVTIARPSLLLGPREDYRWGEKFGQLLGRLAPAGVRPIPARDVAAALTLAAREARHGTHVLTSRAMRGAAIRLSDLST